MTLQQYIKQISPRKFCKLYGVSESTASKLVNKKAGVSTELAFEIKTKTKGLVTYEGMIEPFHRAKLARKSQTQNNQEPI